MAFLVEKSNDIILTGAEFAQVSITSDALAQEHVSHLENRLFRVTFAPNADRTYVKVRILPQELGLPKKNVGKARELSFRVDGILAR